MRPSKREDRDSSSEQKGKEKEESCSHRKRVGEMKGQVRGGKGEKGCTLPPAMLRGHMETGPSLPTSLTRPLPRSGLPPAQPLKDPLSRPSQSIRLGFVGKEKS